MTTEAQRPARYVPRPDRKESVRDKACTWRLLRNTCCGSCGCIEESTDDELSNESSSSSIEWKARRHLASTNDLSNDLEELNGVRLHRRSTEDQHRRRRRHKWSCNFQHFFQKCALKAQSVSSSELLAPKQMRTILINEKQTANFPSNYTVTAKYNSFNFLPIFLYEQFRRYSNIFFLCMAVLQQIPGVSPTGRYITLFPLLFILAVSAIKEIVEDSKRHVVDNENNKRPVEYFNLGNWKTTTWKQISVGDIVRVHANQYFPADLVLLSSKSSDGMCFVKTANLDGESNLKMRQALPETRDIIDIQRISALRGTIECQVPNRRIYDFFGVLKTGQTTVAFGPKQFLQRGAALSNTKWIIGIAVYTGNETKLMKSYARSTLKSSTVDRSLNRQFLSLFALYVVAALMSAGVSMYWLTQNGGRHLYLGLHDSKMDFKTITITCLSFLILYNNMIPISLQVTVEMVHFFQAVFMNADLEMYDPVTDTCAVVRSSNLNEELGIVDYVLTDKTGTLTCNIMEFKTCSIAGILYDLPKGNMEGSELVRNMREGHPTAPIIEEFMLAITLCHSVVSERRDDGAIVYHATNADDQAIIEGAAQCGYKFLRRGHNYVDILRFGNEERYTILQIIEFTSSRKRMSVLVRMPDGRIKLFCKGADAVILARLSSEVERSYYGITSQHLRTLASKGLRTLCCAVADIPEDIFTEWIQLYRDATTAFSNREEQMEAVAHEIEQNLILLGVTAVEDKLQDGVPETIKFILAAGIHIWMLTGDQQETAINVGFASGLLNHSMRLTIVNESNFRNTEITLNGHYMNLDKIRNTALVINGKTLEFALSKKLRDIFKELCAKCRVVIFCRMSPMQKGGIADLVNSIGACTLAIGDGANDVSMIRKARVGVGISGLEGYQAAASSDFSISQFRFLKRLMFVHGTWNFHRITTLTLYCFYKNIILTITMMWFCFYNGWSAQVLYDRWVIAFFNIAHTSWPPLAIGLMDKVCSAKNLLKYPRIYNRARNSKLLNVGIFWIWMCNAFLHSILLFWTPLWLFYSNEVAWPEGRSMDIIMHGNMVYTSTVSVVCLKAGIIIHSWNYLTHIAIWGSFGLWFITVIVYSYCWPRLPTGSAFVYSHVMMFPSVIFWIYVTISVVITLLPDFFLKVFLNRYFLPLNDLAFRDETPKTSKLT